MQRVRCVTGPDLGWACLAVQKRGLTKDFIFLVFSFLFHGPHCSQPSPEVQLQLQVSLNTFSVTLEKHWLPHSTFCRRSQCGNEIFPVCTPTEKLQFCFLLLWLFFPDKGRTLISNLFLGTKSSNWVLFLSSALITMTRQLCLCYSFRKTSPDFKWREKAHTKQSQWRICSQAIARRDIMLLFIVTCHSNDSL